MTHWLAKAYAEAPLLHPVVVPMPCRFGCEDSIGLFYTPEGCACHPENHIMALCGQHAVGLETNHIQMIARWLHAGSKPYPGSPERAAG